MPGSERDRDAAGRPRNARPRDASGRPLPYGQVGVAPVPEEELGPEESLRRAQKLLDEGRAFFAHEVLESSWKAAPDAERGAWRSLAQMAVGLTHAQRGNRRGAAALLGRAADGLATAAVEVGEQFAAYGTDLARLAAVARTRHEAATTGEADIRSVADEPVPLVTRPERR